MPDTQNAAPQMLYETHRQTPAASRALLNSLHEVFARDLGMQLSAYLRTNVNARPASLEECAYPDFLAQKGTHSCIGVLTVQPMGWHVLVELEAALVFPLLELMLGAKPASRPIPDRGPTDIEKQLIAILMRSIGAELERAWSAAAQISLQFRGIETQSQLSRVFASTENVILASFDVMAAERGGTLTVVSPALALDSLLETAARGEALDSEIPDEANISRAMLDADVQLDVWLTGVTLALRDLVQLREGHVIKSDHPMDRRFFCTLNGEAGFKGQVVSTGHKRALLIEEGPGFAASSGVAG
jgi:flagellar motor switch protein FliM